MISPTPIVPEVDGRSMNPWMTTVAGAMSYWKPVMTHLLVFWIMQPTCPEFPACASNADPLLAELLQ